jgi:hypothetical protein
MSDLRRYAFVIEAVDASDALVRILSLFAVQPLALASASLVQAAGGCAIRIEVDGLDPQRAETLLRRLDGLPIVRSVGLGWSQPAGRAPRRASSSGDQVASVAPLASASAATWL